MPTNDASADSRAVADQISYGTGHSSLGTVLVACSGSGVCAVSIGSAVKELTDDLAIQFSGATLKQDDAKLAPDVKKIVDFIEKPVNTPHFPLDVRGTEFQRRVWDVLLRVPPGKTITYTALAKRIGEPNAVRAVASACAANALALAIPCHRVVRSDGTLAGYRWSIEIKRALLAREAMTA
jgi:methylated-DNA-[protein]-cysteine S-methyltransferase/AraC family transcriptional regulator of adaptative response/methylated-DNA-[protein]-cysteine methyltransferase